MQILDWQYILLYFFENEAKNVVTVNGECYQNMIIAFYYTQFNNMDLQDIWFQQDSAIYHTVKNTWDKNFLFHKMATKITIEVL